MTPDSKLTEIALALRAKADSAAQAACAHRDRGDTDMADFYTGVHCGTLTALNIVVAIRAGEVAA